MIQTITIIVSAIIAVLGWIVVHFLSQKRQIEEKKREIRVKYLREAYQTLANIADHDLNPESLKSFQSALNDIQLFGSRSQITIVGDLVKSMTNKEPADLNELLKHLRNEIRTSIGLDGIDDYRWHVRIEWEEENNRGIDRRR
jgi:hypothetical protein